MTPRTITLIGLPAADANRLRATLQDTVGVACAVAETANAIIPESWVLCTSDWVDRMMDRQADGERNRVAVLWGNRPLNAVTQRWIDQGLPVLTGALPQPVLAWAQSVVAAPNEDFLTWDQSLGPSQAFDTPRTSAPGLDHPLTAGLHSVRDVHPVLATMRERLPAGRSVAVYSSGGGVGKTTTAVYLATLAAGRHHSATVLELDEDRRGILTYWNQRPRGEGLDSIPAADWTDPERLAERLATLAVTATPRLTVVPMAGTVTGLQYPVANGEMAIAHLLAWARQQGGWTFVDLPARLRDHTILSVLKIVDQVLWVVEPTELMLDSSRLYLDLLEQLGPDGVALVRKVSLLVNKVEKARAARLDSRAFAEALGLPLLGSIASNPVKYLSGINQHRIDPTPEWESVADRLGIPNAEAPGGRSRGWLRSRGRRKEREP